MKNNLFLVIMFFSLSTIGQTVNEEIKNNPLEILVYPNPMLDQCWVKADEGSNCELINSLGELIQSWTMDSKKLFLITDLKTGFYQLSIEKDGDKIIKKIVVL